MVIIYASFLRAECPFLYDSSLLPLVVHEHATLNQTPFNLQLKSLYLIENVWNWVKPDWIISTVSDFSVQ